MGFGVWGLGFGVWGLGFRVSGRSPRAYKPPLTEEATAAGVKVVDSTDGCYAANDGRDTGRNAVEAQD